MQIKNKINKLKWVHVVFGLVGVVQEKFNGDDVHHDAKAQSAYFKVVWDEPVGTIWLIKHL